MWRGLDGLRRILHLILLLFIFGVLFGALRGTVPSLPHSAALFLQPQGEIVEQLASDPIRRAFDEASGRGVTQTLLWDLTESILAAADDDRIKVIVLQLDYFEGAGQPTLTEIATALKQFRATGKKVVAHAGSYSQASFFLAAFADEIYLDPMGEVLLEGYQRYRMYYKGLLDKLAVDVHLFRVGAWKSAAEDLIRTDMSPEDRSESEVYLNALWDGYTKTVAEARGMEPASIDDYANGFIEALRRSAGNAAAVALDAGLVTGLATEGEFTARVAALLEAELDQAKYPSVKLKDYLLVMRTENRLRRHPGPHVGVVIASGQIADGEQPPGTVGGVTTSALLRDARENDNVAAVVLRIDSPGGSVFASEQIYREVLALKAAGKPVVVSMGDMAASGGYYIAAPADRIFASPMSITGSIGIYATIPTLDRTLGKLGITVDGVGTTAMSGKLRIDRPLDPALRDYITLTIGRGYELFLSHVAAGRGTTRDAVHEVAQGRVWVGEDALRLKLVDELGTYQDAVSAAAKLAKLPEGYGVDRIEPDLTWAEQLASQFRLHGARLGGYLLGPSLGALRSQFEPLSAAQTELERLRKLAGNRTPLAYCFCSVE